MVDEILDKYMKMKPVEDLREQLDLRIKLKNKVKLL